MQWHGLGNVHQILIINVWLHLLWPSPHQFKLRYPWGGVLMVLPKPGTGELSHQLNSWGIGLTLKALHLIFPSYSLISSRVGGAWCFIHLSKTQIISHRQQQIFICLTVHLLFLINLDIYYFARVNLKDGAVLHFLCHYQELLGPLPPVIPLPYE